MSVIGKIFRFQCRYMPSTRFFDRLIALQGFLYTHRRLPSKRRLLNDVLHAEKIAIDLENPIFGFTTDKEYVKDYVAARVGCDHVVKTLGVIRSKREVDDFVFPDNCCIKPTHLSGHVEFRRNGERVDKGRLKSWFHMNHYYCSRERQYKNLAPKIIIEPIVADPKFLRDYKVFCYQGRPTVVQVDIDRYEDHRRLYFTSSFEELPFTTVYPRGAELIEKPEKWDMMMDIARKVSCPFRFCRVDFYITDSVFVGEITHHHESAYARFIPREDEYTWSKTFFDADAHME